MRNFNYCIIRDQNILETPCVQVSHLKNMRATPSLARKTQFKKLKLKNFSFHPKILLQFTEPNFVSWREIFCTATIQEWRIQHEPISLFTLIWLNAPKVNRTLWGEEKMSCYRCCSLSSHAPPKNVHCKLLW